ncbi:MAG: glutamyl-tRNA amidotransferase [Rhodospirillaceae bacterium]|nr:glutamyl-tRNA amidotransferase [Rhodospirillaceae bacterium]
MLRNTLSESLKDAMRSQDKVAISTLRLVLAALKDRDIAARAYGNSIDLGDLEILSMLETMVKQRRESIKMYETGGRKELAQQERDEIAIIKRFMPKQLNDGEIETAVMAAIDEVGADSLKQMGKVMASLRRNHAGQMDFGKAGAIAKQRLA